MLGYSRGVFRYLWRCFWVSRLSFSLKVVASLRQRWGLTETSRWVFPFVMSGLEFGLLAIIQALLRTHLVNEPPFGDRGFTKPQYQLFLVISSILCTPMIFIYLHISYFSETNSDRDVLPTPNKFYEPQDKALDICFKGSDWRVWSLYYSIYALSPVPADVQPRSTHDQYSSYSGVRTSLGLNVWTMRRWLYGTR